MSKGTNEFGGSRGFQTKELPALTFSADKDGEDGKKGCYEGGHRPPSTAPVQENKRLCKDAYDNTHAAGPFFLKYSLIPTQQVDFFKCRLKVFSNH